MLMIKGWGMEAVAAGGEKKRRVFFATLISPYPPAIQIRNTHYRADGFFSRVCVLDAKLRWRKNCENFQIGTGH